jgi:tRNA-(MS[2]IO[6]A)-hydroxylase MiaE-like protein
MLCLKVPTDGAWTAEAMRDVDAVLVDQAHCELKAASNALSLAARHPVDLDLVRTLTDLAREEIEHFQRVLAVLAARGLPPSIRTRPSCAAPRASSRTTPVRVLARARSSIACSSALSSRRARANASSCSRRPPRRNLATPSFMPSGAICSPPRRAITGPSSISRCALPETIARASQRDSRGSQTSKVASSKPSRAAARRGPRGRRFTADRPPDASLIMPDPSLQDLGALDRDVARASKMLASWRDRLARDPDAEADEQPLDALRRVAGKSTWDGLTQLTPSVADEPLRDALKRWVYTFVQARIGQPDEVACARAAAAAGGRVEVDRARLVNWRDAWRGLVHAGTPQEVRLWLSAAADCAPHLGEANRARAARRTEVARRMGLGHPWEPVVPMAPGVLRTTAARLLDATEDVARSLAKNVVYREADVAGILCGAVGREAREGWPARLIPRWLDELFGPGVRGLPIRLPTLPAALGGASFGRALESFGFALRVAAAPSSLPFALAQEPAFVAAHRFAFVFGALVVDPEFYVRCLGLGRDAAQAQARVLARTALLETRLGAARVLLGDDEAFAPKDLFEEIGARLFGAPLDPRLRGAWPGTREDEPARWVALLQARAMRDTLREYFDVDWFKNPRAWLYLRAMGAAPASEPLEEKALDAAASGMGRAFERLLG